jgi:uncharacterized membrane protein YhaH (DUF805 family)
MKIFISKNGQHLGEFELTEVNDKLQCGQIAPADLAWHEGLPNWIPVRSIPGVLTEPPLLLKESPESKTSISANPFYWFFYSLKNYSNFKGRARRREWWSFWFIHSIPYIPSAVVSSVIDSSHGVEISIMQSMFFLSIAIFTIVYWLAMITPFLSVTTRRLHDVGMSAWWLLLVFTPCIGGLFLTVCAFIPGKKIPNKYGDLPSL